MKEKRTATLAGPSRKRAALASRADPQGTQYSTSVSPSPSGVGTKPGGEAGSTTKQEQARNMRRCRLRGIKRRNGADDAHVGTRHGQRHWEAAAQEVANSTKQYSPFPRCPERSARRCLQRSRLTSRSAPGGVTLSLRCTAALVGMGNDWQHWAEWARRGLTAVEQVLRKGSWQRG